MAITTDQQYILNNLAGGVAGKVQLGTLIKNVSSAFVPVYAGTFTTTADGSSPYTNAVTVTGLLSTDIVIALVKTVGASPVTVTAATPTANTLTVRFSADPSTDHVIQYLVLRAAT